MNTAFELFVISMKKKRKDYLKIKTIKKKFHKLVYNSLYRYDSRNTEKYGHIK